MISKTFIISLIFIITTIQSDFILAMKRNRIHLNAEQQALLNAALAKANNLEGLSVKELNKCLFRAIDNNDKNRVENLLNHGAQTIARDAHGYTPLHRSCEKGDIDITILLIEHNADVNAQDFSDIGTTGTTPLHLAYNEAIIEILMFNGANINARGAVDDYTPIEKFAYYGKLNLVNCILLLQDQFHSEDQFGRISEDNMFRLKIALKQSSHIHNACYSNRCCDIEKNYYSLPALAIKLGYYSLFDYLEITEQDEPFIEKSSRTLAKKFLSSAHEYFPQGPRGNLPILKF